MPSKPLTATLISLLLLCASGSTAATEVMPRPVTPDAASATYTPLNAVALPSAGGLQARVGLLPRESVAQVELTAEERQRMAEDNAGAAAGAPLKLGLVKPVAVGLDLTPLDVAAMTDQTYSFSGGMVRRADGQLSSVLRLDTAGASAVRLRIDHLQLPEGAALYLYNDAGDVRGPYRPRSNRFWTHSIAGEQIYVQVEQSDQADQRASLHIGAVLALEADPRSLFVVNAPCVEDASCYNAADWPHIESVRKAVARYNFIEDGASYLCSGGLLADTTDATRLPYFLTAHHCVNDPAVAETVETWFNYRTATCNADGPSMPGESSTLGATLLSSSAVDDHSLLVLDQPPPEGAWYLGWTSIPVANSNSTLLYRISHPRGSPQAYSVHRVDTTLGPGTICGTMTMPRGPYIFTRDVFGGLEGGSSGSPVLTAAGQVVGQLFGVCGSNVMDACDRVRNTTVDGAFANYFARVSQWLDPQPKSLPLSIHKIGDGQGRVQAESVRSSADGSVRTLLSGARQVEQSDRPWQAAIRINTWRVRSPWAPEPEIEDEDYFIERDWSCGGTVIAPNWVLTSAHCVGRYIDGLYGGHWRWVTVAPSNIELRVGSTRFDFGGQQVQVKRIFSHPDFDPINYNHDLALLELMDPVFVEPLRPVTLEREETLACRDTEATVTGWSDVVLCNGHQARVLTSLDTRLVERDVCNVTFQDAPFNVRMTRNMICSRTTNQQGLCQFDDGSPLVVRNGRGGFAQAGVVSRGNDCERTLTAHTRLANYVPWLEATTGQDLTSELGSEVIDCGLTCVANYPQGSTVVLRATPAPDAVFAGWTGACSGADPVCEVPMTQAQYAKASFRVQQFNAYSCIAGVPDREPR